MGTAINRARNATRFLAALFSGVIMLAAASEARASSKGTTSAAAGSRPSPGGCGRTQLALVAGQDAVVDFRLARTGRVSGTVWLDADGDGVLDEGEQPLADVRVVSAGGRDTLTDENGVFALGDLPPGQHVLLIDEKTLPDGTKSRAGSVTVNVSGGKDTAAADLPVIRIPAAVKRFD